MGDIWYMAIIIILLPKQNGRSTSTFVQQGAWVHSLYTFQDQDTLIEQSHTDLPAHISFAPLGDGN